MYPIKGIRGVRLDQSRLTAQGLPHDRRFMLCRVVAPQGRLERMQLSNTPQLALFEPTWVAASDIQVGYLGSPDIAHVDADTVLPLLLLRRRCRGAHGASRARAGPW